MARIVGVATVLTALLIAGILAFVWEGSTTHRELGPGDSVVLDSGVSLLVPQDWEGFYERFAHLPTWLPLGENRSMKRSEYLLLRESAPADEGVHFMFVSYNHDERPPIDEPVLAEGDGTTVYGVVGDTAVWVEATLPDSSTGFVRVALLDDPATSLGDVWKLLGLRGIPVPQ